MLFDGNTIQNGQGVWQSLGGQEIGSIWGHGAYVAPDWSRRLASPRSCLHPRYMGTAIGRPGTTLRCRRSSRRR
jgi:nitric oxide reductase large subunit